MVTGPGKDAEFSAFVREVSPRLARAAWLLTGDHHRAEELVQGALVKTYLAWPRASAGDPAAYAHRVLVNQRIDTWRRRRREVLLEPARMPQGAVDFPAGGAGDQDLLVRALLQLPPKRRRVVVLRYLMDMAETDVADDLGLSAGAVKSAAARGLAQLRQIMGVDGAGTDGRETR
nr:SigE family RNA polymerase sigma factor [Xylanimonas oleitrophica]